MLFDERHVVPTIEVPAELAGAMRAFENAHGPLFRRAVDECNPDVERALAIVGMMPKILMPRRVAVRLGRARLGEHVIRVKAGRSPQSFEAVSCSSKPTRWQPSAKAQGSAAPS